MNTFEAHSLEQWEHLITNNLLSASVAEADSGIRGRMVHHDLGASVSLTETTQQGAIRAVRTERAVKHSARDDMMILCAHVYGAARVHQYGRVAELTPGAGVLYDASSTLEIAFPSDMQSLALLFPRNLLPGNTTVASEFCARRMDPRAPSMRLLSGYLTHLNDLAADLPTEQRLAAGQAALDLLAMALHNLKPVVPDTGGANDVLLQMMREHVRDHLSDTGLTVEELARRHHISARRSYDVFAKMDTTPAAFIREQRLLAAQAMLCDPKYDTRPVSTIAHAVGFGELTTFERAFRRQFGMPPGRWRREHRDTRVTAPAVNPAGISA